MIPAHEKPVDLNYINMMATGLMIEVEMYSILLSVALQSLGHHVLS